MDEKGYLTFYYCFQVFISSVIASLPHQNPLQSYLIKTIEELALIEKWDKSIKEANQYLKAKAERFPISDETKYNQSDLIVIYSHSLCGSSIAGHLLRDVLLPVFFNLQNGGYHNYNFEHCYITINPDVIIHYTIVQDDKCSNEFVQEFNQVDIIGHLLVSQPICCKLDADLLIEFVTIGGDLDVLIPPVFDFEHMIQQYEVMGIISDANATIQEFNTLRNVHATALLKRKRVLEEPTLIANIVPHNLLSELDNDNSDFGLFDDSDFGLLENSQIISDASDGWNSELLYSEHLSKSNSKYWNC